MYKSCLGKKFIFIINILNKITMIIAIEGVNNAGKTTFTNLLYNRLKEMNQMYNDIDFFQFTDIEKLKFPTKKIDVLESDDIDKKNEKYHFHNLVDKLLQHKKLNSFLDKNKCLILDRYVDSSIVYDIYRSVHCDDSKFNNFDFNMVFDCVRYTKTQQDRLYTYYNKFTFQGYDDCQYNNFNTITIPKPDVILWFRRNKQMSLEDIFIDNLYKILYEDHNSNIIEVNDFINSDQSKVVDDMIKEIYKFT